MSLFQRTGFRPFFISHASRNFMVRTQVRTIFIRVSGLFRQCFHDRDWRGAVRGCLSLLWSNFVVRKVRFYPIRQQKRPGVNPAFLFGSVWSGGSLSARFRFSWKR